MHVSYKKEFVPWNKKTHFGNKSIRFTPEKRLISQITKEYKYRRLAPHDDLKK